MGRSYDILVENTGNEQSIQPYFCTSRCPCKLPLKPPPYLYVCNDISRDNETVIERNLYDCGDSNQCDPNRKTTRIQDCQLQPRKFPYFGLM